MKIGIIRKRYTFHGGAEGFSEAFIKKLIEHGHDVHIFAIDWINAINHPNIHLHKVPAIRFNSFIRDLSFAISTFLILKKQRKNLDIIQSHDKTLYQDIYRAGDGCHIEWLRQRWKRESIVKRLSIILNPYHWLILSLEWLIFKGHRFKKVIAISQLVKDNIIHHYHIDDNDIKVIYNGVDLERFHPQNRNRFGQEIRRVYEIKDNDFVVLFVGSGFKRKGLNYLIEAIELIEKPVTLMVVGRGVIKGDVRQRVISCGPRRDIHKYYACADIFAFPTVYEPFGNVHLEALASGLPVITSRHSGASEIIEDGRQGFIIDEPEDIEGIAQRIRLLMDSERRREMGIEARNLAERFSFDTHIKEVERLFQSITD